MKYLTALNIKSKYWQCFLQGQLYLLEQRGFYNVGAYKII